MATTRSDPASPPGRCAPLVGSGGRVGEGVTAAWPSVCQAKRSGRGGLWGRNKKGVVVVSPEQAVVWDLSLFRVLCCTPCRNSGRVGVPVFLGSPHRSCINA